MTTSDNPLLTSGVFQVSNHLSSIPNGNAIGGNGASGGVPPSYSFVQQNGHQHLQRPPLPVIVQLNTEQPNEVDHTLFKILKMIFLIMSIIGLIVVVILVVATIMATLRVSSSAYLQPTFVTIGGRNYPIDTIDSGPSNFRRYTMLAGMVSIACLQVYGIYMENFCLVVSFAILYAIKTFFSFHTMLMPMFLVYFAIAASYLFFAYMIREKQKRLQRNAQYLAAAAEMYG